MNHLDKLLEDLSKSPIINLKFKGNMKNLKLVAKTFYYFGYEQAQQEDYYRKWKLDYNI